MSGGTHCSCPGPGRTDHWIVTTHRANYSAFNGYRRTPSRYSEVRCGRCGSRWRTDAAYADTLPRAAEA